MMAGTKVAAALAAAIAICVPEPEQGTVVPNYIQYAFVYNLARPPVKVDSGEVEQEFLVEAVPVVWAESRGDPDAVNPTSGTCGLFQIHPVHWRRFERFGGWGWCTDPKANLLVAHEIWLEQGWRPWGR